MNKPVAGLLNKLLIEFTQSPNDNALVEGKTAQWCASTYAHIPQKYAGLINEFNRDFLNPYLNFHRDARGKQKKLYRYDTDDDPLRKAQVAPQRHALPRPASPSSNSMHWPCK